MTGFGAPPAEPEERWPKLAPPAKPDEIVSVLMTEEMARRFEERCLGENTRGRTSLSPLLVFSPNDLPSYIIAVDPNEDRQRAQEPAPNCGCGSDCRYASRTGALPDGVVCRERAS